MPIYEIQTPTGDILEIEGPENADEAVLAQAAQSYLAASTAPQQNAPEREGLGFFGGVKEAITGAQRETETTRTLPEWTGMPELNQLSGASFLTALGTLAAGPDEIAQILKSNFPDVGVRQDEKGNYVFKSSVDGQEYAVPPGFSVGDIPRAAGSVLAFTPAGRATTLGGAALAAGGTQAAIEATQAAVGGGFNPGDVALAGALGPVGPLAARTASAVKQGVIDPAKRLLQRTFGTEPTQQVATQAIEQAPARALPQQLPQVAEQVPVPAQGAVETTAKTAQPVGEAAQKDIGALVQRAVRDKRGAKQQLASELDLNIDALAAAERRGIDLPIDVFSDSDLVRNAAALPRNVLGSEAESQFQRAVVTAANKFDELLAQFDAVPDTSAVSQKVLDGLNATRNEFKKAAKDGYEQIDAAVPKSTKVQLNNVKKLLDETLADLGGDTSRLKAVEKELLKDAESETLTYEGLRRIKDEVFEALNGKDNEYSKNLSVGIIKRLYGAVAEDQLDNVGRIAGEEARTQLRQANFATARQKALEKRIVSAFGREAEGSLTPLLKRAVTAGAKGDIKPLRQLLKTVPEELQREALGSAIAAASRARSGVTKTGLGATSDLGLAEFANFYRGMRQNSETFKLISQTMGKDAMDMMRDFFEVSRYVTDARARILTTGKANQALKEAMTAEGLIANVLNSSLGRRGAQAAGAGVGATTFGPVGAIVGVSIAESLAQSLSIGGKRTLEATGKLFSSPEFKDLAVKAATGQKIRKGDTFKLATSSAFKRFAEAAQLPKERGARERWITQSLLAGSNQLNNEGE